MSEKRKTKKCPDCGPLPVNHFANWLDGFFALITFNHFLFSRPSLVYFFSGLIDEAFVRLGIFREESEFPEGAVSLRTTVFTDEARKRGFEFAVLKSRFGFLNQFRMRINGKTFHFEGLPRAEFLGGGNNLERLLDDKWAAKKYLRRAGFPTADGASFWFFQKRKAMKWAEKAGFPLVVKPRFGSMSQHVTVGISDRGALGGAIDKAVKYCPAFIVEKQIVNAGVYRATVVDFDFTACVRRVPAHVIGDGQRSVAELIELKNADSRRGKPKQKDATLFRLVIDETSGKLLEKMRYDFSSVPKNGEIVYLQEKVILDMGADLFEVTDDVHPDNLKLFREAAELFGVRLVGVDFLAADISVSWKEQPCAIIELNSLPYIDMHHFPSAGRPQNIAAALVKMAEKYYR